MSGLLETFGFKKPKITPEMVERRRQEAVAAIKELEPFVAKDEKTEGVRNQLAVRLGNVVRGTRALDLKYEDLDEIIEDAKAAIKPAKKRKAEIETREIANGPDGLKTLDVMVESLGGSAKSEDTKNFVIGAIKARYKIDMLDGEMTTKALPKLYKVLGMVPDWQVRDNPDLKNIKRVRSGPEGASLYAKGPSQEKDRPGDLVYLELGRTGTFHLTSETYKSDSGKKLKLNEFSVTTLHEIGHSVDQTLHFMAGREEDAKYGNWKIEQRENIAALVANEKGFLKGWEKAYDPRLLTDLLDGVLRDGKFDLKRWDDLGGNVGKVLGDKQDPVVINELIADAGVTLAEHAREGFVRTGAVTPEERDNARNTANPAVERKWSLLRRDVQDFVVKAIIDDRLPAAEAAASAVSRWRASQTTLTPNDREKLEKHPAVEHCRAIRITGENAGLWDQGASAAGKYTIKGRVYQQAYTSSWVSYAFSSRTRGISQYQFRHPMEWFAELYAVYYLGKLPKTHADAKWLNEEIDTKERPRQGGG